MPETRSMPEVDRSAAARRAVERRRARASLKRDLAMRVVTPQEVLRRALDDAASVAGSLRITDFLIALPAIGAGKRDQILADLHIAPVKRLGGLGVRQVADGGHPGLESRRAEGGQDRLDPRARKADDGDGAATGRGRQGEDGVGHD